MIHEELLNELDSWHLESDYDYKLVNALRTVVEMHYPHEITWAVKQPFISCYSCAEEYPCPTIETITEELGGK